MKLLTRVVLVVHLAFASTSMALSTCDLSCTLDVAQFWSEPILEPNGDLKVNASEATREMGEQWPYVGAVFDKPNGTEVGHNVELCTRVNKGDLWICEGSYIDLYGCKGHLAFTGVYSDNSTKGEYVITGGTGDFDGAHGVIFDAFDYESLYALRTVHIGM